MTPLGCRRNNLNGATPFSPRVRTKPFNRTLSKSPEGETRDGKNLSPQQARRCPSRYGGTAWVKVKRSRLGKSYRVMDMD